MELGDGDIKGEANLGTVKADDTRLRQMLENLFKNTFEHAENADTIRVEKLEDGVAIEDNGCGIPSNEREEVLQYGYTNSVNGSGLGLAIVREIVNAHGWEIRVTQGSKSGGARFEITGMAPKKSI